MESIILSLLMLVSPPSEFKGPGHFYGAWEIKNELGTTTKIYTEEFFIFGTYNHEDGAFVQAGGGTWELKNEGISETYEFHSKRPEVVGTTVLVKFKGDHDDIPLSVLNPWDNEEYEMNKIDDGNSSLFGAWRITQRERNGEMNVMQMGSRKTMKVLSGTRFQWAAFDVDSKSFMGTGGGTFTAENGNYIENIGFFSRDNSRVGASLSFEFEVKGKDWHHKGLSSRGQPIYEVWTNQK